MTRSEVYPKNLTIDITLHSASGDGSGVYTLNNSIDISTPCSETSLYVIVCFDSNALVSGIIKGYITGRSLNLIDIENMRYIAGRGFMLSSLVENTSRFNEGSLSSPNFAENSNYNNVGALDSSSFVDETGYVAEQGLHSLDFIDENVGHIIGESFGSLDVAENTDVAEDTSYIEEESLSLLGVAENTSHITGENLSSLGAAEYTGHIGESLSSLGASENTGHISLNLLNQYYVVYRIEENNKLTSVRFIDKEVLNMPNIRKLVQKRICLKCRKLFNYPSQLKNHIKSHSGEK
ncbi:1267_t:CDS:1, partial [Acaulospora morrowiae]